MKIAYIIPRLKDSGLTRIPLWLSNSFYPEHEVKVFYFSETNSEEKCLSFNAPVQKISFNGFCQELKDYDIVHSHGLKPDLYLAINYHKIKGIKITTIHGYHVDELSYDKGSLLGYIWGNLWNLACRKLDLAVCISQTMERYYQGIGYKNTTVIYNGIKKMDDSVKTIKGSNIKTGDKIVIGTVSILNKRKGVEQIIQVLQKNTLYHLIAIGGTSQDINRLQVLAEKLGVAQRCVFTGYRENPWETAINIDVFVFPSRSEGFGLALVEAANLEIPIICSDIPTFREIFRENEVTFFQLDDIDDLNNKILMLDEIKDKVSLAKLKAEKLFSLESMCYNYYQDYKNLIDAN